MKTWSGGGYARTVAVVGLAAGAACALALLVRYGLIERDDLGPLCDATGAPWWCSLRMLVIRAFVNDVFALASLALAAFAWWRGSTVAAYAAIALGTCGMVLYTFTWSAAGVLAGALVVARLARPWDEHREAEQQAR